jgi:DNA-directed RNA polymerase subunit RPC12/RpoP
MFAVVEKMKCFLCSKEADVLPKQDAEYHNIRCQNCGEYKITIQAVEILKYMHEDIKYILSSQTFEKYHYERKPLTIQIAHITNAKDITLSEKLYKLSKYFYNETKFRGLGTKIDGDFSQFYCKNNDEYFHLLKTLKSLNIIEIERFDGPSGAKGSRNIMYDSPKLSSFAILAFEKGINSIEEFEEVFMSRKKDGDNYIKIQGNKNMINLATGNGQMTANQYNSLDITELNTLFENVIKALPQNISNEKRNEVNENLSVIKAEIQSPEPQKIIIKNTLFALNAIVKTTAFLASLAKLAEFLQPYFS